MMKILIISLIFFTLPLYFVENKVILCVVFLIILLVVFILYSKRWLKDVHIGFDCLKVLYFFRFLGTNEIIIDYSSIDSVIFYDYMSGTPAHFKIKYENNI